MAGLDPDAGYGFSPSGDRYEADRHHGAAWVNWFGAACSLGLVIGLAVWGYRTVQRDVSGIPVIQAVADPMRVRPDDPGGARADYQGLAVNQVQAAGAVGSPSDQVVLAPAPLDLTARPEVQPRPQQNGSAGAEPRSDLAPGALQAMADALSQGANRLEPVDPAPGIASALLTIPTSVPGVKTSPRPTPRPRVARSSSAASSATAQQAVANAPAAPSARASVFVDIASVASGTRMVQFGAFDSAAIAANEWERLSARFREYIGDKRPVIQRAVSGGREFHRLRVIGFNDVGESRRFCSVFLTENTPCIPVVMK